MQQEGTRNEAACHRGGNGGRRWGEEIANRVKTWFYRSPDEFWEGMCGREGIALVKDVEVLKAYCTAMN